MIGLLFLACLTGSSMMLVAVSERSKLYMVPLGFVLIWIIQAAHDTFTPI